jgi:spermidine synthase
MGLKADLSAGWQAPKIVPVLTALGGFSQFGQILTFREIMAQCHGSELLFGLMLGAWLLWAAAGTALGAWWGTTWRDQNGYRPLKVLALSTLASGPVLAGQILWLRLAPWGSAAVSGQLLSPAQSALLSLLAPAPLALLAGYQFSLALRAAPSQSVGPLFRAEAWGAMGGGLLTALVLVHLSGALSLALSIGALLTVPVLLLLRIQTQKPLTVSGALLAVVMLVAAALPLDRWSEERSWGHRLPGHSLLQVQNTRYGRLALLQDKGGQQISVFQNGEFLAAVNEADNTTARQLAAVACGQHPDPSSALLIGGLLSHLPAAMLQHGLKSLEVAELDPAVGQLATRLGLVPARDHRVRLISEDGRALVKHTAPETWDLVVAVLPEPDSALTNRYCTREFFWEVKQRLKPGGVFCLFLPAYGATASYTGPILARRTEAVLAALDEVFGETRAAPLGGHLLVASDRPGQSSFDPDVLAGRILRRPQARPYSETLEGGRLTRQDLGMAQCLLYFETLLGGTLARQPSLLDDTLHQPLLENFQKTLRSYPVKANRDGQPVEIPYSFILSGMMAQGNVEATENFGRWYVRLTEWLGSRTASLPLAVLFLVVMSAGAAWPRNKKLAARYQAASAFPALFRLALPAYATGAFAMTILITLLYIYQNLCGYVYVDVGAFSAMFMAGLALGALAAERWKYATSGRLAALLGAMMVLCLLPSILFGGLASGGCIRPLMGALLLAAGFADGAMFLLLTRQGPGWLPGGPGPWVYSADLVGSGLAAFLTGAVLIPALGTAWTLGLTAVLLAVAVMALPVWRRQASTDL